MIEYVEVVAAQHASVKDRRERNRISQRKYYAANKAKCNEKSKQWAKANPERVLERVLRWQRDNPDKVRLHQRTCHTKEYRRQQYIKHKDDPKQRERRREYIRRRRSTDVNYRLKNLLSTRTRIAIISQLGDKCYKTMELVGCTIPFLRTYLESLWLPGMSWETYGRGGWSIDHIIACSRFDLTDYTQQKTCFHWSNLQPLWEIDNIRKGTKLPSEWLVMKAATPGHYP